MFTVSRSRRKFLTGAAGLTAVAALSAAGMPAANRAATWASVSPATHSVWPAAT